MISFKSIKIVSLLVAIGMTTVACDQVSRGLGSLTSNKYAKPRSGSVWVVPPPQLEPVALDKKTVYISFRNISDADMDLTETLKQAATEQGWVVVRDPTKATFRLRASLRFWGEVKPETGGANKASSMGGITGAAVGLGAAAALHSSGRSGLTSAAVGIGVGGLVAVGMSNASRPREWALICDFVLEEYTKEAVSFTLARASGSASSAGAGASGSRMSVGGGTSQSNTSSGSLTKKSNYFPHGIRLSVWANQMNMKEMEAQPHVDKRLQKVVKQMLPQ